MKEFKLESKISPRKALMATHVDTSTSAQKCRMCSSYVVIPLVLKAIKSRRTLIFTKVKKSTYWKTIKLSTILDGRQEKKICRVVSPSLVDSIFLKELSLMTNLPNSWPQTRMYGLQTSHLTTWSLTISLTFSAKMMSLWPRMISYKAEKKQMSWLPVHDFVQNPKPSTNLGAMP